LVSIADTVFKLPGDNELDDVVDPMVVAGRSALDELETANEVPLNELGTADEGLNELGTADEIIASTVACTIDVWVLMPSSRC